MKNLLATSIVLCSLSSYGMDNCSMKLKVTGDVPKSSMESVFKSAGEVLSRKGYAIEDSNETRFLLIIDTLKLPEGERFSQAYMENQETQEVKVKRYVGNTDASAFGIRRNRSWALTVKALVRKLPKCRID